MEEEEEEKRYLAVWFYKELHGMMPTSVMPILASIGKIIQSPREPYYRNHARLLFLGSAHSIPIIPTFFSLYT